MAAYSSDREYRRARVITSDTLDRLGEIASRFLEHPADVDLRLREGSSNTAKELSVILADHLVLSTEIQSIQLSGYSGGEVSRQIRIYITAAGGYAQATLTGTRDRVLPTRDEVDAVMISTEQWYATPEILESLPAQTIVWTVSTLLITYLILLASQVKVVSAELFVSATISAAILSFILESFVKRLFPKLGFDIGRSRRKLERARQARKFMFGFVMLSVLGGIVSSYGFKWLDQSRSNTGGAETNTTSR